MSAISIFLSITRQAPPRVAARHRLPKLVDLRLKEIARHDQRFYRLLNIPEDMPSSHRSYADLTVARIRREAAVIGPLAAVLCDLILEYRPRRRPRASRPQRPARRACRRVFAPQARLNRKGCGEDACPGGQARTTLRVARIPTAQQQSIRSD